jgi:signal transduction histidine kinase/ActR/RegA family two-component response regulator
MSAELKKHPSKKIIHTLILLFALLMAAIIANAIHAAVRINQDLLRRAQEDTQTRLTILKSAHESQLEKLDILAEVAKEQNTRFCDFIDYDNLPALTYMLKSLVLIHRIDFAAVLDETDALYASYPAQGSLTAADMAPYLIGQGNSGVSLVELPPSFAKAFSLDLSSEDLPTAYLGFRAIVPLLHDTGDHYGHIVLVKLINGNRELQEQMAQHAELDFAYFAHDKSTLLTSFAPPGMDFPETATISVGEKRYFTAVTDLYNDTGMRIGHLAVVQDQGPYISQHRSILAGMLLPFLLSGVMSLILFILLKRRVFDKVNVLSDALRKVTRGEGDMSIRVPVRKDAPPDEVVYMLLDFNQMMDKLAVTSNQMLVAREAVEKANQELETRVKERTAQLSEMYQNLKVEMEERQRAVEQQQTLQRSLERARKMESLGTLAGGIAHDLNNILSGLVSYPELLLLELPEDSPMRDPISTIKTSGEKAAQIVQDLLTLTRRGVATFEPLDLNTIISDYLDSPEHHKLQTYHPEVRIRCKLNDALRTIGGSAVHLSKVIMNLVSNAAEAMPEGGRIEIKTANRYLETPVSGYDRVVEGEYACLGIADNGVGIDPEDLERIFEPFFTKKGLGRSGTGLGMSVVWGSVEDHQGYIDVRSEAGIGTEFSIYLPAIEAAVREKTEKVPLDLLRGNREAVLIVDDVQEQLEIASKMVISLGYEAVTVSSGEAAIDYLKQNHADVLVLDMLMPPGMDGLTTYEQILAFKPWQKAIIASGFSETVRVRKAQQLGAGEYIKKPYGLEKLGLALKAILARQPHTAPRHPPN